MRKVIFVGGTSFSGSTFFHMILANHPRGFATGEIHTLFYPHRADHKNKANNCGCDDPTCDLWHRILDRGDKNAYDTIFDLFPDIEFIVDSSKSPFWIQSQSQNLLRKGVQVRNILIWKTPLEFAHSSQKRGRLQDWDRSWINYHRLYFTLIKKWRAIQYSKLVNDISLLTDVCQYLDIPYFSGKEAYWQKTHHILGGNYSAKMHLPSIEIAKKYESSYDKDRMRFYRSIYHRPVEDEKLRQVVEHKVAHSKRFQQVTQLLHEYDVASEQSRMEASHLTRLRFPWPLKESRWWKYTIKKLIGKYKYRQVHRT